MSTTVREHVGAPTWYEPRLDVLRFGAFLCVFFSHNLDVSTFAPAWLRQRLWALALFGLVLFFVLSAFLLSRLMTLEFDRLERIDLRRFFQRRILRIWPLYLVVVLGATVVSVALAASPHLEQITRVSAINVMRLRDLPSYLLFIANWFLPLTASKGNFLPHLWSLSVEEQFYLLLPALFLWTRRSRLVLPAVCIVGTIATMALVLGGASPRLVSSATTTFAVSFASGMYLTEREVSLRVRLSLAHVRRWGLVLLALACVLFAVEIPSLSRAFGDFSLMIAVPIETVLAVSWIGLRLAEPSKALAAGTKIMAWLGKRGYGLYVFHWPILQALLQVPFFAPGGRINAAGVCVSFAATVAISAVSYRWFEVRFLAWRRRLQMV